MGSVSMCHILGRLACCVNTLTERPQDCQSHHPAGERLLRPIALAFSDSLGREAIPLAIDKSANVANS
jgi:hypothetical protein